MKSELWNATQAYAFLYNNSFKKTGKGNSRTHNSQQNFRVVKGLDQKWSGHTKSANSLQEKEGLENAFKSSSICPAVQVGEGFRNCKGSDQG